MAAMPNPALSTPVQRWERVRKPLAYGLLLGWLLCLSGLALYLYRAETPTDRKILDQVRQVSRQVNAIRYSQMFAAHEQDELRRLLQTMLDRLPVPDQPSHPPGPAQPDQEGAPHEEP